ncbi:hypothetical protein N7527_009327 [Penicillium freii]|nr:hypothetical protein N7527_009327 [Penicillium freii]
MRLHPQTVLALYQPRSTALSTLGTSVSLRFNTHWPCVAHVLWLFPKAVTESCILGACTVQHQDMSRILWLGTVGDVAMRHDNWISSRCAPNSFEPDIPR